MRTAIAIVWWMGLIGALVPTLVIVKEALLVIGTLRRILHLAEATHLAAQGIVVHLAAVPRLQGLADLVQQIDALVGNVNKALAGLAPRLERETRDR